MQEGEISSCLSVTLVCGKQSNKMVYAACCMPWKIGLGMDRSGGGDCILKGEYRVQ